jgi:hypothetical protein
VPRSGPRIRSPRKAKPRGVAIASLYDFIGAKPGASPEEIERLIHDTRTRFQQTGQLYKDSNEQRLAEVQRVLLDPEERAAYDTRHGIAAPALQETQPPPPSKIGIKPATSRQRVTLLAVLIAVFVVVIGFLSFRHFQHWPTGIYLNSVMNGQRVAVFLERESNHPFPNGKRLTACKVRMLDTDEIRWMSEAQLHAEFEKGPPAAPSDLK